MKLFLLAALLAPPATPSLAQVASIESNRPASAKADPNKKICERIEETGTRLGARRVCMTRQEWDAQRSNHRNEVERTQQNTTYKPGG